MATQSKNTNSYNRQNWETSDFPILCETCLGDNPYLRMTKEPYGKECKICERPFTIFRWKPGAKMRFKKTEVCQTCAKLKNVCQTCLLDLEYGLPTQVRDAALGIDEAMPTSDVNREYYTQNQEAALTQAGGLTPVGQLGKAESAGYSKGHELLKKLARKKPYYRRNLPHICSFYVAGECTRGEECPYRHELPKDPNGPLAKQNMKDRYYGVSDPVAEKMMSKSADKQKKLEPPEDKSVMNLFVVGVEEPFVTQSNLRDHFYQYGEIHKINVLKKSKAALIHYTTREAAEKAAYNNTEGLELNGRRLKVMWGKSRQAVAKSFPGGKSEALFGAGAGAAPTPAAAPEGGFMLPPAPPKALSGNSAAKPFYPSQDPSRMGARAAQPTGAGGPMRGGGGGPMRGGGRK